MKKFKIITLGLIIFFFLCFFLVLVSKKITAWNLFNFKLPKYISHQEVESKNDFRGEIYFNNEFKTNLFSEIIIKKIKNAKKTIDLAMYSFNLEGFKEELYRAKQRGVKITMIFDKEKEEQHNLVFYDLPSGIKRIDANTDLGYMHHKFLIIDEGTNNQNLIVESLNWTDWQEQFDPSFLFTTNEEEIIKTYYHEFIRLKNGLSGIKKLGENGYRPWAKRINFNDCFFDLWWSPGFKTNSLNEKIIDLIKEAEKDIEIMIWQLTDRKIAKAILQKAEQGINIKIITDDFNLWKPDSAFNLLLYEKWRKKIDNLEILDDVWRTFDFNDEIPGSIGEEIFNSFLHHHVLIIDGKTALFGTNNWSLLANYNNDESAFITDNQKIVSGFQQSFDFHYHQLRNHLLSVSKENNQLSLRDKKEYKNQKIIVIVSRDILVNEKPLICLDKTTEDSLLLPKQCQSIALSIFIYDQDYKIIANNLIGP
ncbi:MAG: phosphatidylserine/phosphatidylglycerophosphate/cardiolipin synthase family protein [Patescibacteria group bacterium]|nr:phosphatidylserine/phosphatidylglycerophosphate/cardiolipin synthase family protein [Patescibacteria group bacterium]MDD5172823.1 phosphatidylserine/phosphatidylglycerophosphate/cardiolipin synthase family protein [Patescibacteria group bacterium]